jgi:nicotinamide riboside kinase
VTARGARPHVNDRLRVALLGAESTGKTTLAHAMAGALRTTGHDAGVVPELLRDWCAREGREPRPEEQLAIAQAQEQAVDDAATRVVIADTTALMVAIYAAMLFEDGVLYRFAIDRLRTYHLILVSGLDLPWVDDGLHRAGPMVRAQVDGQLRQVLARESLPYRVVYGTGDERHRNALAPVLALLGAAPTGEDEAWRRWQWSCQKCGDPACEHRLFSQLRRRER